MTWVFSEKLRMNFTIWLKQHVVYQFRDHIFGMMFCSFQPSIFLGSIILNGQIPVWFISSFPKKTRLWIWLLTHNLPHSSFQRQLKRTSFLSWCREGEKNMSSLPVVPMGPIGPFSKWGGVISIFWIIVRLKRTSEAILVVTGIVGWKKSGMWTKNYFLLLNDL